MTEDHEHLKESRSSRAASFFRVSRHGYQASKKKPQPENNVNSLMTQYALDCGFHLTESQIINLVDAVKDYAKQDNAGGVFIHQNLRGKTSLTKTISQAPLNFLSTAPREEVKSTSGCLSSVKRTVAKNPLLVCWFIAYVILSISLMSYKGYVYRNSGAAMIVGRVSAMGIYINITLSALCILRKSISALRKTFLADVLPLDDHISIHKFLGRVLFLCSIIHTGAHIVRYVMSDRYKVWEYLFTLRADEGWVNGSAGITGVLLTVMSITITLFSMSYFRRNGFFELFHWAHHIAVFYWIALIIHAADFWKWFLVPAFILLCEVVLRVFAQFRDRYKDEFKIEDFDLLPSKVTKLKIRRPEWFQFSPGDYVFVNIPSIAKHEWHPFTISSAPEEPDVLTLHIRSLGNWTTKLHSKMKFIECCHDASLQHRQSMAVAGLHDEYGNMIDETTESTLATISEDTATHDQDITPSITTETMGKIQEISEDEEKEQNDVIAVSNPTSQESSNGNHITLKVMISDKDIGGKDNHGITEDSHSTTSKHGRRPDSPRMKPCPYAVVKLGGVLSENNSQIFVDGPYGTPSSDIFNSRHAILIAAGIGVTPFASILQSVMYRYRKSKSVCPNCSHEWVKDTPSFLKLRKVDFVWINSNFQAFEWFMSILSELEQEQHRIGGENDDFLSVHLFLKGVFGQRGNHKAAGLKLALDLSYEKHQVDVLTGLKTKMHTGSPDWEQLFSKYKSHPHGKPKVFFCGPRGLGQVIMKSALEHKFCFKTEKF